MERLLAQLDTIGSGELKTNDRTFSDQGIEDFLAVEQTLSTRFIDGIRLGLNQNDLERDLSRY